MASKLSARASAETRCTVMERSLNRQRDTEQAQSAITTTFRKYDPNAAKAYPDRIRDVLPEGVRYAIKRHESEVY